MRKIILAAALAIPTAALAADPVEDTIKARQGFYKLLGANMGVLAGMAKGEIDYDSAAAQTAADNMGTLTMYNVGHLYMPGTSNADSDKTRALPKIWEDFPGVQEKGGAFVDAVKAMQAVAGAGKDQMAAALGPLGGTCKACHDNYRAK
ncbi:c-type cytochrome [Aliiroseovarius sp. S253]|uniref:c-type cytochrome n=1 Tax=Aliiroseovarius sp. S253 TaxID=3415133 RepID=UPI003C79BEB2